MDKILTALANLISVAEHSPVLAFMILCLLFGMIVAGVLYKHLTFIVEHFPTASKEKAQLERQILADTLVQDALNELLVDTHADRVAIHQFTNGVKDITGLPFSYSEMRFLAMKKGVSLSPDLQPGRGASKMPLSNFNDLLKVMWKSGKEPVCAKLAIEDFHNPTMLSILQDNGAELIYATPILNMKKMPVGMMIATYLDRTKPVAHNFSDPEIQFQLALRAKDIAGYLLAVSEPKKIKKK